eukprot:4858274-Prymnesium_polylepis.2
MQQRPSPAKRDAERAALGAEALDALLRCVSVVVDDGRPHVGAVRADLVRPSGEQLDRHERRAMRGVVP